MTEEMKQRKVLETVWETKRKMGVLTDDELEGVAGGFGDTLGGTLGGGPDATVLTGKFFVLLCPCCGWTAAYDKKSSFDVSRALQDHARAVSTCYNRTFEEYPFN